MNIKSPWHTSILLISSAVILIASFVLYGNVFVRPHINTETIEEIKEATVATSTQTEIATMYEDMTEKDFAAFASTVIEKRCPFYVPDGSSYRECLSEWMNSLQSKAIDEENTEVNNYCQTFTTKYQKEESLASAELFMKCVIFTFSK